MLAVSTTVNTIRPAAAATVLPRSQIMSFNFKMITLCFGTASKKFLGSKPGMTTLAIPQANVVTNVAAAERM